MTKHSLAYSLLALGPYVFASSNKRWVELQSFSFVWWVCCVDHSLFQIIFVCLHRSRLPLNAKPLWNLSAYMSVALLNEVPTNPPVRLSLKSDPRRPSQKSCSLLCVCVCVRLFFPLLVSQVKSPFKLSHNVIWDGPNLWWNTENPVTLQSRAASLSR